MSGLFYKLLVLLILLGYGLFPGPKTVRADESPLIRAGEYFRRGQYEEALTFYQKSEGADRVSGIVGASRSLAMIGQYTESENICRQSLKESPGDVRIATQLAEVLTLTGRSDEALEIMKQAVESSAPTVRSLVQYGKLLQLRGHRDQALSFFEKAIDQYNEGLVFEGEEIAMVGVAAWALESFHDANRLFQEAIRVDPAHLETQTLWGELFLEKYNKPEAQQSFGRVLYQNKRYLPALVGMAKIMGGSKAQEILEAALEVNQYSVFALEALAEISIEDDQFEVAETYLEQSLVINPESLNAQTLRAAIASLNENEQTYQTIRKTVEQFSPGNGWFYSRIAEILGRKYRFSEAMELARQAIEVDPQHWHGYTVLGMNLLRLGQEEEGRIHLENSFDKDPFNLWTKNMLRVLEVLDEFETRQTDHFIVRMHQRDSDILWPQLEPLLTEAWQTLTAKYQFTPKTPILIEIFHEKEDFAVRTLGLPDIGPLVGVCFGNVITLASPVALKPAGSINWQEIIWHEFVHVITLQMTHNRMPRWLSEGISKERKAMG